MNFNDKLGAMSLRAWTCSGGALCQDFSFICLVIQMDLVCQKTRLGREHEKNN